MFENMLVYKYFDNFITFMRIYFPIHPDKKAFN